MGSNRMFLLRAGGTSPPCEGGAGGVNDAELLRRADATIPQSTAVRQSRTGPWFRSDTPPAPPSQGGDDVHRNRNEKQARAEPTFHHRSGQGGWSRRSHEPRTRFRGGWARLRPLGAGPFLAFDSWQAWPVGPCWRRLRRVAIIGVTSRPLRDSCRAGMRRGNPWNRP